jgi:hypothetical protein
MSPPAGPIYASSLHRRDRAWGLRRRVTVVRLVALCASGGALAALLIQHLS